MVIPSRPSLRHLSRHLFRHEWHYFDLSKLGAGADIISLSHAYDLDGLPAPARSERIRSLCLDLTADEARLWRRLKKGCRYDIRRAEAEGVLCHVTRAPSEADLRGFVAAADDLYKRKRVGVFPLDFYIGCAARGELLFSRAQREGRMLSAHVHLICGERALLLNSISLLHGRDPAERQRAGRANRLNHWRDMLAAKAEGCAILDLGAWGETGAEDQPRNQSLKAFKLGFGAYEREAWYLTLTPTRRGRIVHALQNLRDALRS